MLTRFVIITLQIQKVVRIIQAHTIKVCYINISKKYNVLSNNRCILCHVEYSSAVGGATDAEREKRWWTVVAGLVPRIINGIKAVG